MTPRSPIAARICLDDEIPDRLQALRDAALRGDGPQLDIQRAMVRLWLMRQPNTAWTRCVRQSLLDSLEAYCWRTSGAAA